MLKNRNILTAVVFLVIGVLLTRSCDGGNESVRTVTKTRVVEVKDTLFVTDTIVKPKVVYVNKTNVETVYIDKPDSIPTIKANKYNQRIVGNRSVADVEVLTTGELLDLKAVVTCRDSIIEKETIITKTKSNVFVSGGIGLYNKGIIRDVKVGLDYNIKNDLLIGIEAGYDLEIQQPFVGFRVGFSL